jgi:hypothetical protein
MATHLRLRRQHLTRQRDAAARAIVAAVFLVACSDAAVVNDAGGQPDASDAAPEAQTIDAGPPDAADAGAGADADAEPPQAVVDVADTACTTIDAGVELVKGPGAPRFVETALVGTTRFAASEDSLVTFQPDGSQPSKTFAPTGADLLVAAAEGSDIAVGQLGGGGIGFTLYDSSGALVGGQTLQSTPPPGDPALAIASSASASLVVWRQDKTLRGVELAPSPGAPRDFAAATFGTSVDVAAASDGASDWAIAWSGDPGDGTWRVRTTFWSATSSNTIVYHGTVPVHVERVVRLSSGYAILASAGNPLSDVLVIFIDDQGAPSATPHRYLGAQYAWDLATGSAGLGLVARRNTEEPTFRALDATGTPLGPWVCLDGPLGTLVGGAGVDGDGSGWAVVYSADDGSARFVRLDANGGVP